MAAFDNCPTGTCPEAIEPGTNGARFESAGSPGLHGDIDLGEGTYRAVPPDEVYDWPECPSN